jgi:peroxiredoxin
MEHSPESRVSPAPAVRRHWGSTLLWVAPGLVLGLALLYGVLTRPSAVPDDTTPRVGQPLADFVLPDLAGRLVQLSALRGKVVFINIWATWCPPCVEEMPTIQRLYERLHDRGVEVLAISIDALGAQVVAPFMQQYRLTFPALLDPKDRIPHLYHTKGVPESFIVDKRGLLVDKVIGPRDWSHPQMIALFERLLAIPATASEANGQTATAGTAPTAAPSQR